MWFSKDDVGSHKRDDTQLFRTFDASHIENSSLEELSERVKLASYSESGLLFTNDGQMSIII